MQDIFAVGDHITTHCTQCHVRRDHIVVAMEGTRIVTVTCATCDSSATFPPASALPKARVARAKSGGSVPPSMEPLWRAKMAAATGKARPYTRTAAYRIDDILLHEQFGKGVVVKLATKKCYVLFQDKARLMASAN
jgi:hypothetical protein